MSPGGARRYNPAPRFGREHDTHRSHMRAPGGGGMNAPVGADPLLDALAARLAGEGDARLRCDGLARLPDTGLAHDHCRLLGTGLLARVPKQSQLALSAADNLAYQAACFERAGASGHTPRLQAVLAPGSDLPMGALIVDEIDGAPPALPDGFAAIARCLAAIHALPLPAAASRPPLKDPADAVADTFTEVLAQSAWLARDDALDPEAGAMIRAELQAAGGDMARAASAAPPRSLISFDAHPGNYLVDAGGRAWLVDLEKARYGVPAFDLAHASLYTSTTWDVAARAALTLEQIAGFHAAWLDAVPPALGDATRPWLLALRRMMWLWSVTWCAKWRVVHLEAAREDRSGSTEDWSAELSDPALVAHVAERVDHYLDPETIARVRSDWTGANALTDLLES